MDRMRLLIVDDHLQVREELRRTLELDLRLEVVGEAADGLEALRLVEEVRPDAVLLDLRMPLLDGLETARRIKQRRPDVRVVAFTIYQDWREEAMAAGVDAFLVKGAPLTELVAAVFASRNQTWRGGGVEKLYAETRGDPQGQPVMLLHAAQFSGWMWTDMARRLPEFHCIVPDLPGIHRSRAVPWESLDRTGQQLAELIGQQQRKVHLVGLSLGAAVGLRVMHAAPQAIGRAVLSGTLTRPVTDVTAALNKLLVWMYGNPRTAPAGGAHVSAPARGQARVRRDSQAYAQGHLPPPARRALLGAVPGQAEEH